MLRETAGLHVVSRVVSTPAGTTQNRHRVIISRIGVVTAETLPNTGDGEQESVHQLAAERCGQLAKLDHDTGLCDDYDEGRVIL